MLELTLAQQELMDQYLRLSEELESLREKPSPSPQDRSRMGELDTELLSLQRRLEDFLQYQGLFP